MRNSDPGVSVVSVQGHDSDLNSILTMQITGCNFQYGPTHCVPLDPGNCMKLWDICSVFRPEILSYFNCSQKSCIHTEFAQFVLLWQLFNSFSILLQQKIFVGWVITIQRYFCLNHTQHEWGTWLPHHNRSLRSFMKGSILFTYLSDCSVKTELVCRDN